MPYSIPAEVEVQIDLLVNSGEFRSADDVRRSVVRALAQRNADLDAIRDGIIQWKAERGMDLYEFVREMRAKFRDSAASTL
jgi:Arc/MetJ-type ribon-helix-helix transcriptional regulator